jgi:hypothetical protein
VFCRRELETVLKRLKNNKDSGGPPINYIKVTSGMCEIILLWLWLEVRLVAGSERNQELSRSVSYPCLYRFKKVKILRKLSHID